jgi:hypothetical protein
MHVQSAVDGGRPASRSTSRIASLLVIRPSSSGSCLVSFARCGLAAADHSDAYAGSSIAITWSIAETCTWMASILAASLPVPPSGSARFRFSSSSTPTLLPLEKEPEGTRRAGYCPGAQRPEGSPGLPHGGTRYPPILRVRAGSQAAGRLDTRGAGPTAQPAHALDQAKWKNPPTPTSRDWPHPGSAAGGCHRSTTN